MGKKSKSPPPAAQQANGATVDPEALASLKDEANVAFAKREYDQALGFWDRALKLAPSGSPEAALLHSNKAAALMAEKKYREAVGECSAALELEPSFFRALVRRSKAYEGLGFLKQALSDMQRANRLDAATQDTRAAEVRLRAVVSGKGGAQKGTGSVSAGPSAARTGRQLIFPAKLSFGDDVRALQLVPGITYLELQEHARQVYPEAAPFVLKYLDREGDLVTIGSRADLQVAMQQSVESARAAQGPRPGAQLQLTPIRLQVVKASSEAEVPPIPAEELAYVQQMLSGLQKAANKQAEDERDAAGGGAAVQIDEWILSFVDLLKEHCGIDPDRPLEASEIGNERLQAAFQEMMNEDAKADELLDEAMDKFEDQVCCGMYNQASVGQYRAEFLMYRTAREGGELSDESRQIIDKHLAAAEAKHCEALAYKPSFLDGYLGLSSVAQSRAKVAANYLLEPVKPREDLSDAAERAAAEESANKAAQKRAFARVTGASAKAAESFMEQSYTLIQEALEKMPAEEKEKEIRPMKPTAEQVPGDPDSEMAVKASLMINLGNAYYEHSILRAAGGLDWRPLVEKAAEQFRAAGAHAVDVRNALKGHPMAEELTDLIGKEEEEKEEKDTEQDEAKAAPKGVPALPKAKTKPAKTTV